jgi:hypothetical protein
MIASLSAARSAGLWPGYELPSGLREYFLRDHNWSARPRASCCRTSSACAGTACRETFCPSGDLPGNVGFSICLVHE